MIRGRIHRSMAGISWVRLVWAICSTALFLTQGTQNQLGGAEVTFPSRAPSPMPPAGLHPSEVPQFVAFSFDDNTFTGYAGTRFTGGIKFILDTFNARTNPRGRGNPATFDGTKATVSLFCIGQNLSAWQWDDPKLVKTAYHDALLAGNELGDHTFEHRPKGEDFSTDAWSNQILPCRQWLTKSFNPQVEESGAGAKDQEVIGFRAPYLALNSDAYAVLKKEHFQYDSSLEEGWQDDQDGTNYLWPYTLDHDSPGHAFTKDWVPSWRPLQTYPGLWELPVYAVMIPPDDKCVQYGAPVGARARAAKACAWFDAASGKFDGVDFNLWAQAKLSKADFLATLKYTLDLRLQGNRCPFIMVFHSDVYSSGVQGLETSVSLADRQALLREFLEYALSKPQVRVTSLKNMLEWLRHPVPLKPRAGAAIKPK